MERPLYLATGIAFSRCTPGVNTPHRLKRTPMRPCATLRLPKRREYNKKAEKNPDITTAFYILKHLSGDPRKNLKGAFSCIESEKGSVVKEAE